MRLIILAALLSQALSATAIMVIHPRNLDPHVARQSWSKRCMGINSLNMLASAVTFITSTPEGISNAIEATCKDIKGNEYSKVVLSQLPDWRASL